MIGFTTTVSFGDLNMREVRPVIQGFDLHIQFALVTACSGKRASCHEGILVFILTGLIILFCDLNSFGGSSLLFLKGAVYAFLVLFLIRPSSASSVHLFTP